MKCKRCSFRCNTIKSMAEHYRKKHPKALKKKPRGTAKIYYVKRNKNIAEQKVYDIIAQIKKIVNKRI